MWDFSFRKNLYLKINSIHGYSSFSNLEVSQTFCLYFYVNRWKDSIRYSHRNNSAKEIIFLFRITPVIVCELFSNPFSIKSSLYYCNDIFTNLYLVVSWRRISSNLLFSDNYLSSCLFYNLSIAFHDTCREWKRALRTYTFIIAFLKESLSKWTVASLSLVFPSWQTLLRAKGLGQIFRFVVHRFGLCITSIRVKSDSFLLFTHLYSFALSTRLVWIHIFCASFFA